MPSGYTAIIGDKKDVTFKEFTVQCARAFGACVMQRDDPMDVPPQKQSVDAYYEDGLKNATRELNTFLKTPKKEMLVKLKKEIQDKNKKVEIYNAKQLKEKAELKERYTSMLKKVEAWQPPTSDHEGLKKFMIQQINESISWDCNVYPDHPISESVREYYNTKLEDFKDTVKNAQKRYDEELNMVTTRNKWIDDLYKSI